MQYALIWGLENPDLVQRIIVLNTPLSPGTPLPFVLQQYQLPIVASFVAQDAMRAERFLEGGCAYAIDPNDCDRYREPFLESMMPGLAVTDLMKRFDMEKTLSKTAALASKDGAGSSVLVAWATDDKYLTQDSAKAFCDQNGANFIAIPVKILMAPQSAPVASSPCFQSGPQGPSSIRPPFRTSFERLQQYQRCGYGIRLTVSMLECRAKPDTSPTLTLQRARTALSRHGADEQVSLHVGHRRLDAFL